MCFDNFLALSLLHLFFGLKKSHLSTFLLHESEHSVDTRELLSRDGPITYGHYNSLVALVAEDVSPETQENVYEADKRVETEVARQHFTFCPVCCIAHLYFSCVYQNMISSFCAELLVSKCSREKPARSAGCPCRNADRKCCLRCGYGQILQCKNGKNEATERENAQRLPVSAFDHHRVENRAEIQ